MDAFKSIAEAIIARGDLTHLVLFLWAGGASLLSVMIFRELTAANRRFDAFVRELARFNRRHTRD